MRKLNAILSMGILVLFLIHGVLGTFQMLGIGSVVLHELAWVMVGLIVLHTVIGIVLTVQSIRAWRRSGTAYWKGNEIFWARRISGFAIMVLIFFHVTAFSYHEEGAYRLAQFTAMKLAVQILLVITIAVHVITNVKPMLMSFGIRSLKERVPDILAGLSVLLLLMAFGFIFYYLRWRA